MDSDYYYYYFDDCNLINYTNDLGENKNEREKVIWYFKRKRLC